MVGVSTCYLLGPLFYAYVLALVQTTQHGQAKDWTQHAMPFLLTLALGLLNAAWPDFERRPIGGALVFVAYHAWALQGLPYFLAAAGARAQRAQCMVSRVDG